VRRIAALGAAEDLLERHETRGVSAADRRENRPHASKGVRRDGDAFGSLRLAPVADRAEHALRRRGRAVFVRPHTTGRAFGGRVLENQIRGPRESRREVLQSIGLAVFDGLFEREQAARHRLISPRQKLLLALRLPVQVFDRHVTLQSRGRVEVARCLVDGVGKGRERINARRARLRDLVGAPGDCGIQGVALE